MTQKEERIKEKKEKVEGAEEMCKAGGGFVDTMEKTCNKCELLDKKVVYCD